MSDSKKTTALTTPGTRKTPVAEERATATVSTAATKERATAANVTTAANDVDAAIPVDATIPVDAADPFPVGTEERTTATLTPTEEITTPAASAAISASASSILWGCA